MSERRPKGGGSELLRDYGPVARRFFSKAKEERVPISGGIELTHRCNLACLHCYVNRSAGDAVAARDEMETADVCRIIDELAELGTVKLTLTGGEPLLRRDFSAIYRHAHDKGILVVVFTNATLVTPAILALWRERPPALVEVTQYGSDAATYNAIANAGGDPYARFRAGLEQLAAAGIRFALKTTAMAGNAGQIPELRRFAESLGVGFRFDTVVSPRIDGGTKPLAQRLPPAEAARLDVELGSATREQWSEYCSALLGNSAERHLRYRCGAGVATFLIDPYGRLHVCELSREPGWDVLAGGFARGWYHEIPQLLATEAPSGDLCASCPTEALCPNCAGMTALEHKTVNQYMCKMTDERSRLSLGASRPTPAGLLQTGKAS